MNPGKEVAMAADFTVAIDAGHGGSDPGATYGSRTEKDDVLRLSKAVGRILTDNGVNVYYVRTGDEYETPFKKATDANNAAADFFISLHRNSSERENQYNGIESLVYSDSGIRATLARNINEELESTGFKNLGVDERPNLVVLKRTNMPAVLVEVGFINNKSDNELFDKNFNAIAQAIADGILKTLYSQTVQSTEASAVPESNPAPSVNTAAPRNPNEEDMIFRNNPPYEQNPYDENHYDGNHYDRNHYDTEQYDNMPYNDVPNNSIPYNATPASQPPSTTPAAPSMPKQMDYNEANWTEEHLERLYRVQVGAYRNKESADRLLNSLLIEGFPAFIVYDDGIYKVQVGAYRFLANAIKMEERLRRFRYNTYITT